MHLILSNLFIHPLIISVIGLLCGLTSGLFGVGGGFIMVPLLIYVGIPVDMAIGVSIAQITTSALTGVYQYKQKNMLDFKMGFIIVGGSLIGIAIGTIAFTMLKTENILNIFLNISYILLIVLITIPFAVISIINDKYQKQHHKRTKLQHFIQGLPFRTRYYQAKVYASIIPPFIVGIFAGTMNAMLGLGGGLIVVPVLTYLMRIKPQIAIGTSLLQMFIISILSTFVQSTVNHNIDLVLLFFIIISSAIGARFGAILSLRLPVLPLKILVLVIYSFVVIHLLFVLFTPPLHPISVLIPLT